MGIVLNLQFLNTSGVYEDVTGETVKTIFSNMDGYSGDEKVVNFKIVAASNGMPGGATSYKNVMMGFSISNNGTKVKLNYVDDKYVCSNAAFNKKVLFGVANEAAENLTPDSNGLFMISSLMENESTIQIKIKNKILERLVSNYGDLMSINNIYIDIYAVPN